MFTPWGNTQGEIPDKELHNITHLHTSHLHPLPFPPPPPSPLHPSLPTTQTHSNVAESKVAGMGGVAACCCSLCSTVEEGGATCPEEAVESTGGWGETRDTSIS